MNISTSNPSPSVGQQLSTRAITEMHDRNVRTIQDQCRIGLHFNDRVTVESDKSTERLVSTVSRRAYSSTQNAYSAYGVLNASFRHLEAGVSGDNYQVLGKVGRDSVFNSSVRTVQDQDRIGLSFLKGMRDHSEGTQNVVADTLLTAYGRTQNAYSALGVIAAGLNSAAAGVGGPVGPALAQVGLQAIYNTHVKTVQDQCRVALEFTKSVGRNDANQTNEANSALALYNQASNAYLALDHLGDFLKQAANPPATPAPVQPAPVPPG
jgi:ribosomal protein L11